MLTVTKVQSAETNAFRNRRAREIPFEELRSECTSSRAAPITDTVLGGLSAVVALSLAASSSVSNEDGASVLALPLVGASLLYSASAVYGYKTTSECIRFKKKVHQTDDDDDEEEELQTLRERVRRLEAQEQ